MSNDTVLVNIDHGRALCWEHRETIRIGFDRGHVRIQSPTPALQHVFQLLVAGMSESDFHALDEVTGPEAGKIRDMVALLAPVLVRRRRPRTELHDGARRHPSAVRTALHDDGRDLPGIRSALEANWLCSFERSSAPPELAVQVLRFLEPLERTRRWLGAGIPHLVIRLTDDAIRVGPLVSADGSPCHSCEVLHLVDADAALPKLAVQLHGKTPGSESPANTQLAGAIAAHVVRAWRGGAQWVHSSQIVLPIAKRHVSGLATVHTIHTHPECGCALSAVSRPPRQTVMAGETRARRSQIPTRAVHLGRV